MGAAQHRFAELSYPDHSDEWPRSDVGSAQARDSGAYFIVTKPLQPGVLWQRILWIARENRAFVESENFVGPDRRFRNMGPPPGMTGRRDGDLDLKVGAALAPNMSDTELSAMFKPMKVAL